MALFSELKRRNVLRMAVLYAVAAWRISLPPSSSFRARKQSPKPVAKCYKGIN